jgi:hypothetical protein
MAAIIARMAHANSLRKKNRWRTLGADKSNKVLKPFDPVFIPEVHNIYLRQGCQMASKAKHFIFELNIFLARLHCTPIRFCGSEV